MNAASYRALPFNVARFVRDYRAFIDANPRKERDMIRHPLDWPAITPDQPLLSADIVRQLRMNAVQAYWWHFVDDYRAWIDERAKEREATTETARTFAMNALYDEALIEEWERF